MMFLLDLVLLFNFILFAFALPLFAAFKYNIAPEKSFLAAFLFNTSLFYISAVFHCSNSMFYLIYGVNMLLYIPILLKWRKTAGQDIADKILTPGCVMPAVIFITFFLFSRNMKANSWDAVSHWMTAVQLFFAEGKLNCEYPAAVLSHASYPPGMPMLAMLVHKCFFGQPFREDITIFAYLVVYFGALSYFYCKIKYSDTVQILCATVAILFPLVFFRHTGVYDFCDTDICLASLMALVFYFTVTMRDYKVSDLWILAMLNSWMFMIRNAGWGYSIGIMILFALLLAADRKKAFFDENGKWLKNKSFAAASVFILPFLFKYFWEFLLKYYQTPLRFGGVNITWENLCNAFVFPGGRGWTLLLSYVIQISCRYLPFFVLLLVISFIFSKKVTDPVSKRAFRIMNYFFSISFLLFLGTMYIYYLFEFNEINNDFPSLRRYTINFTIIPMFVLLLISFDIFSRIHIETQKIFFKYPVNYILPALVIIFFNFVLTYPTYGAKMFEAWRKDCERVRMYDKLFTQGIKFAMISFESSGFKGYAMANLYPYNFIRNFPDAPRHPQTKGIKKYIYCTEITPVELLKKFKEVHYIYIDNTAEGFLSDFKGIFVRGFEPTEANTEGKLFEVTADGCLKPVSV